MQFSWFASIMFVESLNRHYNQLVFLTFFSAFPFLTIVWSVGPFRKLLLIIVKPFFEIQNRQFFHKFVQHKHLIFRIDLSATNTKSSKNFNIFSLIQQKIIKTKHFPWLKGWSLPRVNNYMAVIEMFLNQIILNWTRIMLS